MVTAWLYVSPHAFTYFIPVTPDLSLASDAGIFSHVPYAATPIPAMPPECIVSSPEWL